MLQSDGNIKMKRLTVFLNLLKLLNNRLRFLMFLNSLSISLCACSQLRSQMLSIFISSLWKWITACVTLCERQRHTWIRNVQNQNDKWIWWPLSVELRISMNLALMASSQSTAQSSWIVSDELNSRVVGVAALMTDGIIVTDLIAWLPWFSLDAKSLSKHSSVNQRLLSQNFDGKACVKLTCWHDRFVFLTQFMAANCCFINTGSFWSILLCLCWTWISFRSSAAKNASFAWDKVVSPSVPNVILHKSHGIALWAAADAES